MVRNFDFGCVAVAEVATMSKGPWKRRADLQEDDELTSLSSSSDLENDDNDKGSGSGVGGPFKDKPPKGAALQDDDELSPLSSSDLENDDKDKGPESGSGGALKDKPPKGLFDNTDSSAPASPCSPKPNSLDDVEADLEALAFGTDKAPADESHLTTIDEVVEETIMEETGEHLNGKEEAARPSDLDEVDNVSNVYEPFMNRSKRGRSPVPKLKIHIPTLQSIVDVTRQAFDPTHNHSDADVRDLERQIKRTQRKIQKKMKKRKVSKASSDDEMEKPATPSTLTPNPYKHFHITGNCKSWKDLKLSDEKRAKCLEMAREFRDRDDAIALTRKLDQEEQDAALARKLQQQERGKGGSHSSAAEGGDKDKDLSGPKPNEVKIEAPGTSATATPSTSTSTGYVPHVHTPNCKSWKDLKLSDEQRAKCLAIAQEFRDRDEAIALVRKLEQEEQAKKNEPKPKGVKTVGPGKR